jgi:hypothetical protein
MKYILTGPHPLEFPGLRVEPSSEGTPFEYELELARELSLAHVIKRAEIEVVAEEPRSTRKGRG